MTEENFIEEQGGAILDAHNRCIGVLLMFLQHLERRLKRYPVSPKRDALLVAVRKTAKDQLAAVLRLAKLVHDYMAFVDSHKPLP